MKKTYQQKLAEAGLIETDDDARARYFRENRAMNNQQLTLISDEQDKPQPVWTKTAIENLINELVATRRQRNELQGLVDDLTAKLEDAESTIKELDNALEQASILLSGSQAELHDLRIKVGLLQPEPDWTQSPAGFDFWAVDKNYDAFFYRSEPRFSEKNGEWLINTDEGATLFDHSFEFSGWDKSLRQRPST